MENTTKFLFFLLVNLVFVTCAQGDAFHCKVHYLSNFQAPQYRALKTASYSLNATLKETANISGGLFCDITTSSRWSPSDIITCKEEGDVLIQLPSHANTMSQVTIILNCSAPFPLDVNATGNLTVGYLKTKYIWGNSGKTEYWLAVVFPNESDMFGESFTMAGMYSFFSKYDSTRNTSVKFQVKLNLTSNDDNNWEDYGEVKLRFSRFLLECKSTSTRAVYFANIGGSNPRHTELLYPCLPKECDCKSKVIGINSGYSNSFKKLENFNPHGAILCSAGENPVIDPLPYFTAIDLEIYTSKEAFEDEKYLIRVGLPDKVKFTKSYKSKSATFFENDTMEFECFKIEYILASPFEWSATYLNEAPDLIPHVNTELNRRNMEVLIRGDIIVASRVRLTARKGMVAVKCSAAFWNSSDTMASAVQDLRIIRQSLSSPPVFSQNETFLDVDIGKGVDLICEAQNAFPWPTYHWEYPLELLNKSEVTLNITTSLNGYTSTLKIYNVSEDHVGRFVCVANNSGGETRQNFNISIRSETKPYVYFGIAAAVITILSTAVVALTRLYYLQRGRLTAAEIKRFETGDAVSLGSGSVNHENAQYMPYNRDYEIKWKIIHKSDEKIGEGEYGVVYKGFLKKDPSTPIAIKTTKFGVEKQVILALLSELKILIYLGKHENVVELKGACTEFLREGRVYVLFEYCPMGSLETHLKDKKYLYTVMKEHENENPCPTSSAGHYRSINEAFSTSKICFDSKDLLNWSIQIARGMRYLSDRKVIHGDLATRNILLSNNLTAKITDFGLSSKLVNYQPYAKNNGAKLPWRWLPPETLKTCNFTNKTDIWSFGITLWEIFSLGDVPYSGFKWTSDFALYLESNLRLSKPQYAPESIYKLMCRCWTVDPSGRPDFEHLEKEIQALSTN